MAFTVDGASTTTWAMRAAASAASVARAERELYRDHEALPARGPLAALTVPGAISGWALALEAARAAGGRLPLASLLGHAIRHAREGYVVTRSQARLTAEKLPELADVPGQAGGNHIESRLRFDRLWLRSSTRHFDLTLGRQPLSFGTAVIYQIIDRIVPLPPFSIDREYKPGVDAIRADVHLAPATDLALVYAFGGDASAHNARIAAALRGPVGAGEGLLFASVLHDMPLFGPEGLGLDSIDTVTLLAELEKRFGISVRDPARAMGVLKNVDTIVDTILAAPQPAES